MKIRAVVWNDQIISGVDIVCIDTAHGDLVPLPFESGLIEGCIEKGKSVQEGGAIWNFSGPQGVGIIDAGDCLYSIQKNVFEKLEKKHLQLINIWG